VFDTGAVGHRVSASVSYFDIDSKNAYALSDFLNSVPLNIYRGNRSPMPPIASGGGVLFSPRTTFETKTKSFALADTLSFIDGKVLTTVGARHQTIEGDTFDYNTGAQLTAYDESKVTPIFGVVVKPWDGVSLYANYIEGLLQGEVAPEFINNVPVRNNGEVFDPFASKQYEVGAKYDSGTLGGTIALFRINQPSTIFDGFFLREDGEQRNQGAEFSVYGQLTDGLRLLGGFTLLDSEYRRTDATVNNGNDVIGTPDTQANIDVEWDVPMLSGLSVDGRVVYTSSQAANEANTLELPSWTRLDVGARYAFAVGENKVTLRARVDNVTDKNFWSSVGGTPGSNYLVLAAPRTFTLSASWDF